MGAFADRHDDGMTIIPPGSKRSQSPVPPSSRSASAPDGNACKAATVPYRRQGRRFSCGPACAWMAFRTMGLRVSEPRLIRILGAASRRGTWPADWRKLADAFPVEIRTDDGLSLRQLERRRRHGWRQILLVTADVPHYVLYLGRDGGDVLVHDPWDGPARRIPARAFARRWQVVDTWTPDRIFHSRRWAVALRPAIAPPAAAPPERPTRNVQAPWAFHAGGRP
jgi:hypothetical protein